MNLFVVILSLTILIFQNFTIILSSREDETFNTELKKLVISNTSESSSEDEEKSISSTKDRYYASGNPKVLQLISRERGEKIMKKIEEQRNSIEDAKSRYESLSDIAQKLVDASNRNREADMNHQKSLYAKWQRARQQYFRHINRKKRFMLALPTFAQSETKNRSSTASKSDNDAESSTANDPTSPE